MTEHSKARFALGLVCFFWGTTYFAIRVAVSELPAILFCAARFLLAGGALFAFALWRGEKLPRGREWLDLALIGFLLLTVGNGTLAWAEQWVPTGLSSLIIVTTPLWLAGFARLAGEPIRPRAVAGLLVGFAGLAVLIFPDLRTLKPDSGFLRGSIALLTGAAVWAFGSIYSKKRPPKTGPVMTLAVEMLTGFVVLGALGLALGQAPLWHPTWRGWLALLYLVVFGSIVGYSSYIYALSRLPTVQVSIYCYVNPIVAVLLGVVFLGERFDIFLVAGIPLMLAGVYLVTSSPARAPGTEVPAPWPKRWFRR